MDCYSCIHWQYWNENPKTYEGYGYCRNPLVRHFGAQTDECDDGCADGDSLNIDKSNQIKLNAEDIPSEPEIFLVRIDKPQAPVSSDRKWFVIKGSEFLAKTGEFKYYSQGEMKPDEILFDSKDQAIAMLESIKTIPSNA